VKCGPAPPLRVMLALSWHEGQRCGVTETRAAAARGGPSAFRSESARQGACAQQLEAVEADLQRGLYLGLRRRRAARLPQQIQHDRGAHLAAAQAARSGAVFQTASKLLAGADIGWRGPLLLTPTEHTDAPDSYLGPMGPMAMGPNIWDILHMGLAKPGSAAMWSGGVSQQAQSSLRTA
jgi:hypothetical protein